MADNVGNVWVTALDRYAESLEVHDQRRIRATPSLEALLSEIEVLRVQYARKAWSRFFDRLAPIIQWLSGFSQCVQAFTQAAPKAFILLWGSLSFILEVSIDVHAGLEYDNSPATWNDKISSDRIPLLPRT